MLWSVARQLRRLCRPGLEVASTGMREDDLDGSCAARQAFEAAGRVPSGLARISRDFGPVVVQIWRFTADCPIGACLGAQERCPRGGTFALDVMSDRSMSTGSGASLDAGDRRMRLRQHVQLLGVEVAYG